MKKLFVLLVLFVAGFAALAYMRGWFRVSTTGQTTANADGTGVGSSGPTNVTVSIDKDKFRDDKAKAASAAHDVKDKAADVVHEVKDKAADVVHSSK